MLKFSKKKVEFYWLLVPFFFWIELLVLIRAFTMGNAILFYFTISKSYFISYTIPFYNTPNIPTFIFLFYSLK